MNRKEAVLADLRDEGDELDRLLDHLKREDWQRETPADGWTVAHQVAHLAWTDYIAVLAALDPGGFETEVGRQRTTAGRSGLGLGDWAAGERVARQTPPELREGWNVGRHRLAAVLADSPDGHRLPWFGPPMSTTSMATARLMETWAHGQDVADTLGIDRTPTARLRHIAHLGVRTRDFAYRINSRTPPERPFRVELTAPDGDRWTWGDADAPDRVTGPALDFCLLVCQRRHPAELAVRASSEAARGWLDIAQAYAGAPGGGRRAPIADLR